MANAIGEEKNTNLPVIYSITLIAIMGISSTSPAFPKLAEEFGISEEKTGLLITFFTAPGIFLTVFLGALADRYGRKKILAPALILYGIAGGLCGFAPSFQALLIFTFFQGVANSPLGALNVTVIGDIYSGKQRVKIMGYNAGILSIGTASYPLLGGLLAGYSWRAPFFLPIAALFVAAAVILFLKNPEPKKELNLKEYLLAAWKSIRAPGVFIHFIISGSVFVLLFGPIINYMPFYLNSKFDAGPVFTGVVFATLSASAAIAASQLGRLTDKFGGANLIKAGFFLFTTALALIPFAPGKYYLLPVIMIYGAGHGMTLPNVQSRLAGLAPEGQRAIFMSANRMNGLIGQATGPLVMAAVFSFFGMPGVFLAGAAISAAMLAFSIAVFKD